MLQPPVPVIENQPPKEASTKAPFEEDEEFDLANSKDLVFECFTDEVIV